MITKEMCFEAIGCLAKHWGVENTCSIVCAACSYKHKMPIKEFLDHCVACGGNWGGMLLTGIKELFPTVWELIPEDMGRQSYSCLCCVLMLCGVDTSAD